MPGGSERPASPLMGRHGEPTPRQAARAGPAAMIAAPRRRSTRGSSSWWPRSLPGWPAQPSRRTSVATCSTRCSASFPPRPAPALRSMQRARRPAPGRGPATLIVVTQHETLGATDAMTSAGATGIPPRSRVRPGAAARSRTRSARRSRAPARSSPRPSRGSRSTPAPAPTTPGPLCAQPRHRGRRQRARRNLAGRQPQPAALPRRQRRAAGPGRQRHARGHPGVRADRRGRADPADPAGGRHGPGGRRHRTRHVSREQRLAGLRIRRDRARQRQRQRLLPSVAGSTPRPGTSPSTRRPRPAVSGPTRPR